MKTTGIARAHTNIALIKYWGKKDKALFLPMNSSLSLTLEAFYTDTKITLDETLEKDEFYLNNVLQQEAETQKISKFLDLFRIPAKETRFARIESYNFVPTAAGLASSASAFAALAGAMHQAMEWDLSRSELSTYARRGSGSSTRSLFGGFVEWNQGTNSEDSMAIPIDDASWDIGMLIVVVNGAAKKISSRIGMEQTVATSPFYPAWVESAKTDLEEIKTAIQEKNFTRMGEITEFNGMKMHATMLASQPPFCYFEPDSLIAQQQVVYLREVLGIPAYYTMDAGPNVKVLCKASDLDKVRDHFEQYFASEKLISSLPGEAMRTLTEDEWQESIQHFNHKGI